MTSEPSPPHDPLDGSGLGAQQREELVRTVAEAERRRARREASQAWVLGAGLAVLALGLPCRRLWGDMDWVRAVVEGRPGFGLGPLLLRATSVLGLEVERAAFLLSALAFGACLPVLRATLRAVGFEHGPSLAGASVATLAPGLVLAGCMPLDLSLGVLGAGVLAGQLFRTEQRTPFGYQWRVTLALFAAVLLRTENLLLLPAVGLALYQRPPHPRLGRWAAPIAMAGVLALSVSILVGTRPGAWSDLLRVLLGGGGGSPADLLRWVPWSLLALGTGSLGLWTLLLGRRDPEESPPPRWVVPWCVAGLVPVLGSPPEAGPAAGFLLPLVAVGVADRLLRVPRPDRVPATAAVLLGVQVALAVGVGLAARLGDPDRAWRAALREHLEPTDVLITSDPDHAYEARARFGLEVRERPRSPDGEGTPPARRQVLDLGWPEGPEDAAGLLRLTERGLVPAR